MFDKDKALEKFKKTYPRWRSIEREQLKKRLLIEKMRKEKIESRMRRMAKILEMKNEHSKTLKEIGDSLGLSREWVRLLLNDYYSAPLPGEELPELN